MHHIYIFSFALATYSVVNEAHFIEAYKIHRARANAGGYHPMTVGTFREFYVTQSPISAGQWANANR